MKPVYRVSTFVGERAKGTAHSVYLRPDLDQAEELKALSHSCEDTLVLVATLEAGTIQASPEVRFFANGHEILRCGSGALAAAWALTETGKADKQTAIELSTSVETIQVLRDGEAFGYTSTPLPQLPLEDPPLWETIVGAILIDGAFCGDAEDYVIVELADEDSVIHAAPDLSTLSLSSERALILTAKSTKGYVLRYFAPQYGLAEGAATGSANIQLLRYWYNHNERVLLFARQCSATGGEFWGVPGPGAVQLFGRVRSQQ